MCEKYYKGKLIASKGCFSFANKNEVEILTNNKGKLVAKFFSRLVPVLAKQAPKKTSLACFPFALQSNGRFCEPLLCL